MHLFAASIARNPSFPFAMTCVCNPPATNFGCALAPLPLAAIPACTHTHATPPFFLQLNDALSASLPCQSGSYTPSTALKCSLPPGPSAVTEPENKRHRFRAPSPLREQLPSSAPALSSAPRPFILPVCAVCLSREIHKSWVINCTATLTWDKQFQTLCTHSNTLLITRDGNQPICAKWQREGGCKDKHPALHTCSGCGADSHGANSCPRAQRATPSNPLQS